MAPNDQSDEQEETFIERTDTGVSVTTKIQRGTGTNDRDSVEAKVKRHSLEEAEKELEELRKPLKEHLSQIRSWQN